MSKRLTADEQLEREARKKRAANFPQNAGTMKTSKELHAEADRLKREANAAERSEKCEALKAKLAWISAELGELTADQLYAVGQRICELEGGVLRATAGEPKVDYAAAAGSGCYE